MPVLVFVHLLGAALWVGGMVTLAAVVLAGARALPREEFRRMMPVVGWAFAGVSVAAWVLLGASGLAMAGGLGWPPPVVAKAGLGAGAVLLAAVHVATGRMRSRAAVAVSRTLSLVIFAASMAAFWLGVQLAVG